MVTRSATMCVAAAAIGAVTMRYLLSRGAKAMRWSALQNDAEIKQFNGDGKIILSKMRMNVPKGKTEGIVVVACGSFSPPTISHFRILEDAKDSLEAAGFHVFGGFMSPVHGLYGKKSLAAMHHRLNMVGSALVHSDWISLDPWECAQDEWTRTALVMDRYQAELDRLYSEGVLPVPARAALLGGADIVESFPAIKADGTRVWAAADVDKICSKGFVAICREGTDLDRLIAKDPLLSPHRSKFHIVIPEVTNTVSSTLVRKKLAAGASAKYLVLDEVIDYIHDHELHRLPNWQ